MSDIVESAIARAVASHKRNRIFDLENRLNLARSNLVDFGEEAQNLLLPLYDKIEELATEIAKRQVENRLAYYLKGSDCE